MQPSNDPVSISQDTYGRWFVEVETNGRKRAPIRCMSRQEAEERASAIRRTGLASPQLRAA